MAVLETSAALTETHGATLLALDKTNLGIFVVEAALKMAAHGREPGRPGTSLLCAARAAG